MSETIEFEVGSDNVFADLGLSDAPELHRRSQIGYHIFKLLETRNLKQKDIGELLSIKQPEVFHLMNGHYSRFTTDKLLDFLQCLDYKVTIQIAPHQPHEPFSEVVMAA